jgi:hypothetical protein
VPDLTYQNKRKIDSRGADVDQGRGVLIGRASRPYLRLSSFYFVPCTNIRFQRQPVSDLPSPIRVVNMSSMSNGSHGTGNEEGDFPKRHTDSGILCGKLGRSLAERVCLLAQEAI